ncbi:Glucose dehydrogenase [FAD, quinone] [Blattella germanica]|nr:Glucose dehydrogenase [FAD, quinone] [Blattella germanica]
MSSACKVTCPADILATFMSIVLKMIPDVPPHDNNPTILDEYDFIIVGGGSAGCVLANRLSEISSWNILLLEAGVEEPPIARVPSLKPFTMAPHLNWNYETVPQPEMCSGKPCKYSRAKMLGGCSSHNMMNYNRGNKRNFDYWAQLGNEGWGYQDVLPYFKKSEDNRDPDIAKDTEHHGLGGYLTVERFPYMDKNAEIICEALKEYGFPFVDSNGKRQDGYSLVQTTSRDGVRMSTSRAFLEPIRHKRKNLHIITKATVNKIIIDSEYKKAIGVQFLLQGEVKEVFVTKEVIVSAGVINSPKLLQLSGIGPVEFLKPLKIPIVQDLKVGYNLDDHFLPQHFVVLKLEKTSTLPKTLDEILADMNKYQKHKNGSFSGLVEVTVFTHSKLAQNGIPDLNFMFCVLYVQEAGSCCQPKKLTVPIPYYNRVGIWPQLGMARSRGTVKINSTDPFSPPKINHNALKDPADLEILIQGLMLAMKMSEAKAFARMGMVVDKTPVARCASIPYGTEQYWRCALKGNVRPSVHGVGTCRMGPSGDPLAVVDPKLRVHGITGLRVIDASVMPSNVNGNTNAATIMIAEKGADIVKKDWGVEL